MVFFSSVLAILSHEFDYILWLMIFLEIVQLKNKINLKYYNVALLELIYQPILNSSKFEIEKKNGISSSVVGGKIVNLGGSF